MSDLISRKAAIAVVNRAVTKEAARWSLQELPSADAIDARQCRECKYKAINKALEAMEQPEIVRCKDCKWCEDADGLMCKNPASWVVATGCDFGCVLAERRQDE